MQNHKHSNSGAGAEYTNIAPGGNLHYIYNTDTGLVTSSYRTSSETRPMNLTYKIWKRIN